MTTNTPPARASLFGAVVNILIVCFVLLMGYLLWPFAVAQWQGIAPGPLALPTTLPTAAVQARTTPAPRAQEGPSAPISAPAGVQPVAIPGIAQNAAEADALYNAAVLAGEQRADPAPAPAILVTKPSVREGAGANVPTAEPVVVVTDWFGSKQAPVNIQATHECKHGQVWVDGKGCRNP
jgi:hypothetical protein